MRKKAEMSKDWQIISGDVSVVLPTLDDASVNLTVTSPPYYQHRDYGVEGQIGREESLTDYLARFRTIFEQLYRITQDNGACFFVIGDTYRSQKLLLVPHRIALIADEAGWIVRNDT